MALTGYYVKNDSTEQKLYGGMLIDATSQYEIQNVDRDHLLNDQVFLDDLGSVAFISDGTFNLSSDRARSFLNVGKEAYASLAGGLDNTDSSSLSNFLDVNAVVTDASTGIRGPFYVMQTLVNRREIFNDSTNPIYDPTLTPILGSDGYLENHAGRINTLETIHNKLGWHNHRIAALISFAHDSTDIMGVNILVSQSSEEGIKAGVQLPEPVRIRYLHKTRVSTGPFLQCRCSTRQLCPHRSSVEGILKCHEYPLRLPSDL